MLEAYSEPSQTSEMELFTESVFKEIFILFIWVLNKPLIVIIDCNMYYCWKATLKTY